MPTPQDVLGKYFGHQDFRGQQREIIERTISGGHSLVIMPTGMGKSLCFQIPALLACQNLPSHTSAATTDRPPLALVVSPLIALMKDQVDALRDKGIDATFVNSSLTRTERESRYQAIGDGRHAMLYVTPERFRKQAFRDVIAKRRIVLLAVDEAHCISEWGHDFRPDYTRLTEIRTSVGNPTTIALTATATPDVQRDIVRQLGLQPTDVRLFHEGIDRPNLSLEVEFVWTEDEKIDEVLAIRDRWTGSGIIYFTLIKTLMRFSDQLVHRKVPHLTYHGDLERGRRKSIQNQFMNRDDQLVLATNAFGMGIDKESIRFVMHADLPGSMEAYYQEIGRAGRDGEPSECRLLYNESDLATQMEFMTWSNPNAEFYERVFDYLKNDSEQIKAFGIEWLREKIHAKQKHDRRLETSLSMLERHGVIEGNLNPLQVEVVRELPPALADRGKLDEKLLRDQKKLLALVEYVRHDGDRKRFIHDYFGIGY